MNAVEIEVQPRDTKKRNQAKALRTAGKVPGVVYGGGDNQLVEVDNKAFERIMHSASSDTVLLELKLGEGNDILNIRSTIADTLYIIETGNGDDVTIVSSTADGDPSGTAAGHLSLVLGDIDLDDAAEVAIEDLLLVVVARLDHAVA